MTGGTVPERNKIKRGGLFAAPLLSVPKVVRDQAGCGAFASTG